MTSNNDLMVKARLRRILGDGGVRLFKKLTGRDQFDECRLFQQVFKGHGRDGVMVDVSAHFGIALALFAGLGWRVYASEPDPKNRSEEHRPELRYLMRSSYAVFCLKPRRNSTCC